MGGSATVIDIVAQVTDETASGARSAEKNVSRLEKAMQSVQQRINDMRGKSKLEIAASLKDMASAGLAKIAGAGKNLAGKAWTVTMKLKDLVTAPFRGIVKMLSNPIVQIAAITGLSLGVADTIDTYKSFQQGMANVKAIVNASDEDFNSLTASAMELGETTMFSASQAAEAMENLAMAGWKANDIISGMPGLLDLAAAGSVDLATASDVVSSAIAQFKLDANEAGKIADILAATATNSKTDVQGLGESLKYAGTMAGSLGYNLEDTALALGLMGNAGVDASSAGSSLRMMFARMSKQEGLTAEESNAVSEAMKKVGVSLTDNKGKMKSMREVMGDLRTGFGKLDEAEQAATAANLAGAYSMTGLLAIVNASDEKFEELAEAIDKSEGAASRMADVKMDTLQGSMYYLQSAAEGVKIAIGDRLEPYLRGFIDWLTGKMPAIKEAAMDAMDFLGEKIQSIQKTIEEITQSNEWKGAISLWDKIKVAWNKIIAEPFDEWWNGSGRAWLSEKANGAGKFLGNFLKTGLLTLLGVDVGEILNEGMAVGKSFMNGFLEGFDTAKVLEGVKKAFKAIVDDAGSGSGTSGLSAALLGIGALKIGSAGITLAKGGKTVFDGVKGIAGAISGAGAGAASSAGAVGASAAGAALTHNVAAAAHTAAPAAASTAAGGQAAWTAAGAAGAGLLPYLGVLAGAAVVIGGITLAVKKNNDAMVQARKEYADGMMFNNGLPKLTEYTAALKANNAETYRLAARINDTASELETIQSEMQDARTAVDFFGTSLRENGTLSPLEAQNMIEPFNKLCEALEKDFTVRYSSVFDAFKLAAGDVATSLGADVAAISETLDQFKQKYTGIVQTSQNNANSILEQLTSGDLTEDERTKLSSDFQKELEKISAYANVEKSESQYNYEQLRDGLGRMDIGENQELAISNLQELSAYSSAYVNELSEAMKQVDLDYENLRGTLKTAFDLGDISQEEYDSFSTAMNMSQAITDKSFMDKINAQKSDIENVQSNLLKQIDDSVYAAAKSNGISFADNYIGTLGMWGDFFAGKGLSMETQSELARGNAINEARKVYQDVIDEVNRLNESVNITPIVIPVIQKIIDEMESGTFDAGNISASETTAEKSKTSASGEVPRHASGGIMTRPHVGLVAEDGAEAIIPLSGKRRDRGLALWKETGRMLGVREYAEGGIVGAIPTIGSGGLGGQLTCITVELGGVEVGGFNITVEGSAAPDEILGIIRANIADLSDEVAGEIAEKLRAVFANMPLKTTG